jgi:hypothetical protein
VPDTGRHESSVYADAAAFNAGALLDGNMDTFFNSDDEAAPFVIFEFDEAKDIAKVVITNRHTTGGDRTKDLDIRLDDSKDAIQAHGSGSMWTGGRLFGHYDGPGDIGSGHEITWLGPQDQGGRGKVVIIQQFNGNSGSGRYMNIAEVQIFAGSDESNSFHFSNRNSCYI